MRKLFLLLVAVLAGLGLLAPAALAAPGNTPHPTASNGDTMQAGRGLLRACNDGGWRALYTPIPTGTAAPADDPATPAVDESDATVYTFTSREQCRNTVNAGLPIGLLNGLPAGTISVPAPSNFPPQAPPATTPNPATATLANVQNGSATTPFSFTVNGTGFTPNAAVSGLFTYRDGHQVVVALGNTSATGTLSHPVAGACVASQVPTAVTLLQTPAGPAATATVPNTVCPGVPTA